MNEQHFFRHVITFFLFAVVLTGCDRITPSRDDPGLFYKKAEAFIEQKDDKAALDALNRGIALDTLDGFSPVTASALNMKRQIEERNGSFYHALDTHALIENRCSGLLGRNQERDRIRDKAIVLSLLGNVDEASGLMREEPGIMRRNDLLMMARWHASAAQYERSADIFLTAAGSDNLVLRLEALAGLLDLSEHHPVKGMHSAAWYASRTIETAKLLLDTPGPPLQHALAMRQAAMSLAETGRHDDDASYIFFKALSYARAAGDRALEQVLDFESNDVLTQNPEVYGRTSAYFEDHGMVIPHALALIGRAQAAGFDERERMRLFQQGIRFLRYQLPSPSPGLVGRRFRKASGELLSLQIARGLYNDAFRVDEALKTREIRGWVLHDPSLFSLPEGHASLRRDIIRLGLEIDALLRRSVEAYASGRGLDLMEFTGHLVSKKRGELNDLLAGISDLAPVERDKMQPEPVTIATLQQSIPPGSAVLKIITSDEWLAVYCISGESVDMVRRKIDAADAEALAALFAGHIGMSQDSALGGIARHSSRLTLTEMIIAPFADRLGNVSHLTCITNMALPVHLLGQNRYLVRDVPVSRLSSAREYLWYSRAQAGAGRQGNEADFIDAMSYQEAAKMKLRHPDHSILLLWKPYHVKELNDARVLLSLALQQGVGPAVVLSQMVRSSAEADGPGWLTLSSYGVR